MIAEVSTSASFGKLRNYLRHGKAGERVPVGERVLREETLNTFAGPKQTAHLLQEMRDQAARSKQVEKPVGHIILSWKDENAPSLDDRFKAGRLMLDEMGLGGHQAYFAAHQNENAADLHIEVNRVGANGKAWRTGWDFAKAEAAADLVSREMDFELTPRHWYSEEVEEAAEREGKKLPRPDRTGPSTAERRKEIETGEQALSEKVADYAKGIFDRAGSWRELQGKLRKINTQVMPKRGGGVVAPLGTEDVEEAETIKLSSIGRDHSFNELEKRFGSFEAFEAQQEILSSQKRGQLPDHASVTAAYRSTETPENIAEALAEIHQTQPPEQAPERSHEQARERVHRRRRSDREQGTALAR